MIVKIAELKEGMNDVNITVEIDYIPPRFKGNNWGIIYVKDESKDIKMILTGKNMKKAKEGMKLKIVKGTVTKNRGELQLNPSKENPVKLVD
jgi:hypothetical protein